jgi:hypothetical protein
MSVRRLRQGVVVIGLAWVFGLPVSGSAQMGERLSLGVTGAYAQLRTKWLGAEDETLAGPLLGIEGRASQWHLHARGEYRQGRLEADGPLGSSRVISARAALGVQLLPWLVLSAGPRLWRVELDSGDRNVLRWGVELHGSAPLIVGLATGYASLGTSVAGTAIDRAVALRSTGGEVGVFVGGLARPLWARLGYRMDREHLSSGSFHAVETTYLAVGVSVPGLP